MKKIKSEKGLLSLEASIALTIFIFMMLFLYSFFVVFEARNEIAHVLLATTKSMSIDTYANKKFGGSGNWSELLYQIYNITKTDNKGFVSSDMWHDGERLGIDKVTWDGNIYVPSTSENVLEPDEYGNISATSTLLESTIRERFIAYLAGGDKEEANNILDKYHIVDGLDGLDFSGSCIKSGKLYIKVRYKLEYEFNMFGFSMIEFEQSACSKMW